jgi:hypothetical protein
VTLRQAIVYAGLSANYDPKAWVELIGHNPSNAKATFRNEAVYLLKDVLDDKGGQPQLLNMDLIYLLPGNATTQATPPR